MEQLLGDNPLLSSLSCSCQSRLDLAGVKLLQTSIFAFGRCSHLHWCHEEGDITLDDQFNIPSSTWTLELEGGKFPLYSFVLHNSLVSVLRDMHRH